MPKKSAAYFREYRRKNRDRIAAQRSARWRRPESVAARAASHVEMPIPSLHLGHALFDLARSVVRDVAPMVVWKSWAELDREDARSEAVLAALEGRDPKAAALGFLRSEVGWHRRTTTLVEAAA